MDEGWQWDMQDFDCTGSGKIYLPVILFLRRTAALRPAEEYGFDRMKLAVCLLFDAGED
jgi:hypothetical protein